MVRTNRQLHPQPLAIIRTLHHPKLQRTSEIRRVRDPERCRRVIGNKLGAARLSHRRQQRHVSNDRGDQRRQIRWRNNRLLLRFGFGNRRDRRNNDSSLNWLWGRNADCFRYRTSIGGSRIRRLQRSKQRCYSVDVRDRNKRRRQIRGAVNTPLSGSVTAVAISTGSSRDSTPSRGAADQSQRRSQPPPKQHRREQLQESLKKMKCMPIGADTATLRETAEIRLRVDRPHE